MSTSFLSLIFAGVVGVGTFAGTLQQNLSHPKTPEIDLLFKEIEKLIRDFSRNNPMTEKNAHEVKTASAQTNTVDNTTKESSNKKSEHTLSVWTALWVGLISNYVRCLQITCKQKFTEKISKDKKQEAIKNAEQAVKDEKEKFENTLNSKKEEIENIYKKMKTFVLKIEIPKEYKYDPGGQQDCPYENHVKKIV